MGPCGAVTLMLSIAPGRPPDVGKPNKDRVSGAWRAAGKFSKTATPEPPAQSAGDGHVSFCLLDLVRLLARQAAREQDRAGSLCIHESNDDEADSPSGASLYEC